MSHSPLTVYDCLQRKFTFPLSVKQITNELDKEQIKVHEFVRTLPILFGGQNGALIQTRLDKKLRELFEVFNCAYQEVYLNLQKGVIQYRIEDFPWVGKILERFRPNSQSNATFLSPIFNDAYNYFPLLQEARSLSSNPKAIRAIKDGRDFGIRALKYLFTMLDKSEESSISLKSDEKTELVRLLYTGGAIFLNGNLFYFFQVFKMWASLHEVHRSQAATILSLLPGSQWVPINIPHTSSLSNEEKSENDHSHFSCLNKSEPIPFFSMLSSMAVDEMEKVLDLELLSSTRNFLLHSCTHEELRSDLVFFTSYLFPLMNIWKYQTKPSENVMGKIEKVMNLDWVQFHESKIILLSIQIFLHITRIVSVPKELRGSLFEIVLHRDSKWNIDQIIGWTRKDKWRERGTDSGRDFYKMVIGQLFELFIGLSGSKKGEEVFSDRYAFPLLYFFLTTKEFPLFIQSFKSLVQSSQMDITPKVAYNFCSANQENGNLLNEFTKEYLNLLALLEKKKVSPGGAEMIFLDPPVVLSKVLESIPFAEMRALEFLTFLEGSLIPLSNINLKWLRHYLFHPTPRLYEHLTEICGKKGICEKHIEEVCLFPQSEVFEKEIDKALVKNANAVTISLGEKYQLDDSQTLSLYLEVLRLHIEGKEAVLKDGENLISEISHYCGYLSNEEIYFLLRYHPKITEPYVFNLTELKEILIRTGLEKFILNQDVVKAIFENCIAFSEILGAASLEYGDRFQAKIVNILLSSAFPPLQPLADYLKIIGISPEKGPKWISSHLVSHLGQYLPIIGSHPTSIYMNWLFIKERPVLFISFSNFEKGLAVSTFVPLELPLGSVLDSSRRHSTESEMHESKSNFSKKIPPSPLIIPGKNGNSLSNGSSLPPHHQRRSDIFTYLNFLIPTLSEKTSSHLDPPTPSAERRKKGLFESPEKIRSLPSSRTTSPLASMVTTPQSTKNQSPSTARKNRSSSDLSSLSEESFGNRIMKGSRESSILTEELDFQLENDSDEWVRNFTGIGDYLEPYEARLSEEERGQIWEFTHQLKQTYRTLLWAQSKNLLPEVDGLSLMQIASQGCIYPIENGSLLPFKTDLMDCYIVDAKDRDIQNLFSSLADLPKDPIALSWNLICTSDGKNRCENPILFSIHTLEDLLEEPINETRKWDERARPFDEVQGGLFISLRSFYKGPVKAFLYYPVKVLESFDLFSKYVRFHNLTLKASIYHAMVTYEDKVVFPKWNFRQEEHKE